MANPSVSRHSIWKNGEYRNEYFSNENSEDFNMGLLKAENVDIRPQGILHRRGGFEVVEGRLQAAEVLLTVNQYETSYTYRLLDVKVAELESNLTGIVLTVQYAPQDTSIQDQDMYLMLYALRSRPLGGDLREVLVEMVTQANSFLTSTGSTAIARGANQFASDRIWGRLVEYTRIPEVGVFKFKGQAPPILTASDIRIEKLSTDIFCFYPTKRTTVNLPIYLSRRDHSKEYSFVGPWGLGLGGNPDLAELSARQEFLRDAPHESVAEFGFKDAEFFRNGIRIINEIPIPDQQNVVYQPSSGESGFYFTRRAAVRLFGSILKSDGTRGDVSDVTVVNPRTGSEITLTSQAVNNAFLAENPFETLVEGQRRLSELEGPMENINRAEMLGLRGVFDEKEGGDTVEDRRDTWWVRARIEPYLLDRIVHSDGMGGFCLV